MLKLIRRLLSGPSDDFTFRRFDSFSEVSIREDTGLYIHIPFCKNSCPYCPYIKTGYNRELANDYKEALKKEISLYYDLFGHKEFSSLYIGGGTPTLMVDELEEILDHLRLHFAVKGDIALETSAEEIDNAKILRLKRLGINMLSLGVQSFNDRCLQKIGRVYDGSKAESALAELAGAGFDSINVDLIFAIKEQTIGDIKNDLSIVIDHQVGQVTCYPLFTFPFTEIGRIRKLRRIKLPGLIARKRMYYAINEYLSEKGYSRTNVWSFSKNPEKNYSSVTRDYFLGLGAGSGSYNGRMFYFNTFSIPEYIRTVNKGLPISIKMDVSQRLEKLIWLYWQLYRTKIDKDAYKSKFGNDPEKDFGWLLKLADLMGFVEYEEEHLVKLNTRGAHWIHLIQNYFALNYVNKIWSVSKSNPWPGQIKI
jgi:oxygen-independent coproporphyrinogen III oxidase